MSRNWDQKSYPYVIIEFTFHFYVVTENESSGEFFVFLTIINCTWVFKCPLCVALYSQCWHWFLTPSCSALMCWFRPALNEALKLHWWHWNVLLSCMDSTCVFRLPLFTFTLKFNAFMNCLNMYFQIWFYCQLNVTKRALKFSFFMNICNVSFKALFMFCFEITLWTWESSTFMNWFSVFLKVYFLCWFMIAMITFVLFTR